MLQQPSHHSLRAILTRNVQCCDAIIALYIDVCPGIGQQCIHHLRTWVVVGSPNCKPVILFAQSLPDPRGHLPNCREWMGK